MKAKDIKVGVTYIDEEGELIRILGASPNRDFLLLWFEGDSSATPYDPDEEVMDMWPLDEDIPL